MGVARLLGIMKSYMILRYLRYMSYQMGGLNGFYFSVCLSLESPAVSRKQDSEDTESYNVEVKMADSLHLEFKHVLAMAIPIVRYHFYH